MDYCKNNYQSYTIISVGVIFPAEMMEMVRKLEDQIHLDVLFARNHYEKVMLDIPHKTRRDDSIHSKFVLCSVPESLVSLVRRRFYNTDECLYVARNHGHYEFVLLSDVFMLEYRQRIRWPTLFCSKCKNLDPQLTHCRAHSGQVKQLDLTFSKNFDVTNVGGYASFLELDEIKLTLITSKDAMLYAGVPNLPDIEHWDTANLESCSSDKVKMIQCSVKDRPQDPHLMKVYEIDKHYRKSIVHRTVEKIFKRSKKASIEVISSNLPQSTLLCPEWIKDTGVDQLGMEDWHRKFVEVCDAVWKTYFNGIKPPVGFQEKYVARAEKRVNHNLENGYKKAKEASSNKDPNSTETERSIMMRAKKNLQSELIKFVKRALEGFARDGYKIRSGEGHLLQSN